MRLNGIKKGFTLIELIISIAIIGILLIAAVTSFSSGFGQVFSNGQRTKCVFEAQSKIDNVINDIEAANGDPQVSVKPFEIQIELYSSGSSNKIKSDIIDGNIIKVDMKDRNKVTLSTFVPN